MRIVSGSRVWLEAQGRLSAALLQRLLVRPSWFDQMAASRGGLLGRRWFRPFWYSQAKLRPVRCHGVVQRYLSPTGLILVTVGNTKGGVNSGFGVMAISTVSPSVLGCLALRFCLGLLELLFIGELSLQNCLPQCTEGLMPGFATEEAMVGTDQRIQYSTCDLVT